MLKGRSGKSFLLGSPPTLTTSSHCWRRRPISSPSAPCFTHTQSTARRQESSRTRFTRYKRHLLPPQSSLRRCWYPFFLFCFVLLLIAVVCYVSMAGTRFNSKPYWTFVLPCSLQADITCPGFQEYHERLQTFLMWFIETASFIDADDDRWDFFLVWVPSLIDIIHPPRTPTPTPTLKPLLCHWKTKPPFVALVTNYQASLIIFPP